MANDFSSKVDILFNDIVENFSAMNLTAKNVSVFRPGAGNLQQSGQTFYRKWKMMTQTEDGRDVSSAYRDLTELTVPTSLTESHLRNVPVQLTGVEINSPHLRQSIMEAAQVQLNNKVDTLIADEIADKATLAVINSGAIDTYTEAGEARALMMEQQVTSSVRCMMLNPRMALQLEGNLASRQTMQGPPLDAYTRAMLPSIAGFQTYSTDYGKTITGSAGAGYLVDGAAQITTPTAKDVNGIPVDNRTQTLTVDTGADAAVGDVFTIAGVNAVGQINKQSTGQLKTFRILAIAGADWTISPAIIPADSATDAIKDYANVTTSPADNAAITILNIATQACSLFYEKSAVELITADWDTSEFSDTGKRVRKLTTDSGIQVVMLADTNIDTLNTKYRMFVWVNANVLNPEACGILLPNQA